MLKKNLVLGFSVLGTIVLILLRGVESFDSYIETSIPSLDIELFFNLLLFSPVVTFFSLLTYKLKASVFATWWKFARWGIPVVLILLLLINTGVFHGQTKGLAGWGDFFADLADLYESIALYVFFTIGSLVQIYRCYRVS